jgi:hypothetical protein
VLNEDVLGSVVVERDPVAIDGAEERSATADFSHPGRLTESKFSNALAKLSVSGELSYQSGFPSRKLAEGDEVERLAGHECGRRKY